MDLENKIEAQRKRMEQEKEQARYADEKGKGRAEESR